MAHLVVARATFKNLVTDVFDRAYPSSQFIYPEILNYTLLLAVPGTVCRQDSQLEPAHLEPQLGQMWIARTTTVRYDTDAMWSHQTTNEQALGTG
jgi:hypothetical protein